MKGEATPLNNSMAETDKDSLVDLYLNLSVSCP